MVITSTGNRIFSAPVPSDEVQCSLHTSSPVKNKFSLNLDRHKMDSCHKYLKIKEQATKSVCYFFLFSFSLYSVVAL